jgi:hypothetical protein
VLIESARKRSLFSIRDASTVNPLPRRRLGKPLPRSRVCSRPHAGSAQHLPAFRYRFPSPRLSCGQRPFLPLLWTISFSVKFPAYSSCRLGDYFFHDPRVREADPYDRVARRVGDICRSFLSYQSVHQPVPRLAYAQLLTTSDFINSFHDYIPEIWLYQDVKASESSTMQ